MCFSPFLGIGSGGGGGASIKGSVHNLLTQFFSLYGPKIEVSATDVFDIGIT